MISFQARALPLSQAAEAVPVAFIFVHPKSRISAHQNTCVRSARKLSIAMVSVSKDLFDFGRSLTPPILERLMSHMASHKLHKCNVSSCGKEFKFKSQLQRHHATSHGNLPMRAGSPRPVMKTRAAFYHVAEPSLRYARRICADVLNIYAVARKPFNSINLVAFKQECMYLDLPFG